MDQHCPFCETGHLHEVTYTERVRAGRKTVDVAGLKKLVCENCGNDSVPMELYAANRAIVKCVLAKTPAAVSVGLLRNLRETWDVSQKEASHIFGAGHSAFAKWESGQVSMSTPSALLVQCAIKFPEVMRYLSELADIQLEPAGTERCFYELASTDWVRMDEFGKNLTFIGCKSARRTQGSRAQVLSHAHSHQITTMKSKSEPTLEWHSA